MEEKMEVEQEKKSAVEIWHGKYKDKTEQLPEEVKQCLYLLRQPIEQGMRKVLKGVSFKTPINVGAWMEAITYEELIFFMPKIVAMYKEAKREVKRILDKPSAQQS